VTRSAKAVALVLFTALLVAAAVIAPASAQEETAQADASEFVPCQGKGDGGVDILFMMDQSGSLNQDGGADPGGFERTEALRRIRDLLKRESSIRVALIGFDDDVDPIMQDFVRPSEDSPSDKQIGDSIGERGDTDYGKALSAAVEAFRGIYQEDDSGERCRVLVFFTDGIYDPINGRNISTGFGSEENWADALVGRTCSPASQDSDGFKEQFDEMGVETYAVLLGDSFRAGLESDDGHKQKMATVSMQVIRALTGHGSSPLVGEVGLDPRCEGWRDHQTGEIITVDDINDLVNALIDVVREVTTLYYGCTDPEAVVSDAGSTVYEYEKHPAGVFIKMLDLSVSGGYITGVRARVQGDVLDLPLDSSQTSRVSFYDEHLEDLAAGWELFVEVTPHPNASRDITIKCGLGNRDRLHFKGEFPDAVGGRLVDIKDYDLWVDMRSANGGPYPCERLDSFRLEPPPDLNVDLPTHDCQGGAVGQALECSNRTGNSTSWRAG